MLTGSSNESSFCFIQIYCIIMLELYVTSENLFRVSSVRSALIMQLLRIFLYAKSCHWILMNISHFMKLSWHHIGVITHCVLYGSDENRWLASSSSRRRLLIFLRQPLSSRRLRPGDAILYDFPAHNQYWTVLSRTLCVLIYVLSHDANSITVFTCAVSCCTNNKISNQAKLNGVLVVLSRVELT